MARFGAHAEADADLLEWDYGAYEGRRTADIEPERSGWHLFDHGCPGGETMEAVGALGVGLKLIQEAKADSAAAR